MATFTAKVVSRRLTLSPFSAEQMFTIGQVMLDKKKDRISQGINSQDNRAKPLAERYARRKLLLGRAPIRDLRWSGLLMGSYKVKSANQDQVTIGFVNDTADARATIQRRREEMITDSPKDLAVYQRVIRATFEQTNMIRVIKVPYWQTA